MGELYEDLKEDDLSTPPYLSALMKFSDGREHFDQDRAIAHLLLDEIVTVGKHTLSGAPTLWRVENDVFAWGYGAICELAPDDIRPLYEAWRANGSLGVVRWVCIKDNMRPQRPYRDDLRRAGLWGTEMDALRPCSYDEKDSP